MKQTNCELGKLALQQGLLEEAQIDAALERQAETGDRLGQILFDLDHLNEGQVKGLRATLQETLISDDTWLADKRVVSEVGRLAVNRELISDDELSACLWSQMLLEVEGVQEDLGDIMIRSGFLTPYQLTESQLYTVLFCNECQALYRVLGYEEGFKIKCFDCPVFLEVPPSDVGLISKHRELFIDTRRHLERERFGTLAIEMRKCTPAHITHATEEWARGGDRSLGEILVDLEYLTDSQHAEINERKAQVAEREKQERRAQFKGAVFGEIGVKLGLFTPKMLHLALKDQQVFTDGRQPHPFIGQLLHTKGYVTISQALRILDLQSKVLVYCTACGKRYTARNDAKLPDCMACAQPVSKLGDVDSLDVAHDLAWGGGAEAPTGA